LTLEDEIAKERARKAELIEEDIKKLQLLKVILLLFQLKLLSP
jgi:hypothetical protein